MRETLVFDNLALVQGDNPVSVFIGIEKIVGDDDDKPFLTVFLQDGEDIF